MRPAFSVIFLTTLIGAGQGLFLALFTVESYAAFGLLPAQEAAFYAQGAAVAFALLVLGLVASFFHLGHPERAWRAVSQWRTSWLSREVIVLPLFMGVVLVYGLVHGLGLNPVLARLPSAAPVTLSAIVGVIGTLLAFALFVCTGMIYACLRFLREWHTPLTVINYILLGGASGFVLATALAAYGESEHARHLLGAWALILTALAFLGRWASLVRNARLKPKSTLQTAIGIKHPKIVQKSMGMSGGAFNTREFFHGKSAIVLRRVKVFFLVCAFFLPAVILMAALAGLGDKLFFFAFVMQYLGLIAERWFFFAQANHPQNLYYQVVS
ncbi:MAG: dimethyl sulfoxide reductase anchor subunit [Rhodocyclaceae bacterium]|nr:dimethyl sulfoxide reductase anchor subunit [Rhodocyclaceae bacterium]